MKVFKTKWFSKFARQERIADSALVEALWRAERGTIDAVLGSGLIKQRVAREGKGRSGGYRVIVAYRSKKLAVFLFGFAKSGRENIGREELLTLREIGESWFAADVQILEKAVLGNLLEEIVYEEQET